MEAVRRVNERGEKEEEETAEAEEEEGAEEEVEEEEVVVGKERTHKLANAHTHARTRSVARHRGGQTLLHVGLL